MALEALLGSILSELVTLAGRSVQCSLGAAWGLKDELEKLRRLLAKIQSVLADAEEKQIRDAAVRMWLDALKRAAYEAEDVVDQFNYEILRHKAAAAAAAPGMNNNRVPGGKVRDFFSSHNQILFRVKMWRKLKNILERIEEIESEGRRFDFAVNSVQPETTTPIRQETSSFVVESDVVGRNEDREKMVMMLIDKSSSENLAVLPIVGMGGLGKTTMAQLIYNDPRVVNHFQLRGWVCVSEDWDMTKIIERAIASIAEEKMGELPTLELKQRRLREALHGKRYLIVLDDIWKEDRAEWEALRGILDCGGGVGSAVVVTTRSHRVGQITGTLPSYHLSCLSEDESWDLFSSRAFAPGVEKPKELVEIGKAIVQKCGGLPLALKMLGSSLYMKWDRKDWLGTRDSSLWNTEDDNILPALRLSYKHLPSYSKRCFAFCATFSKRRLIEKNMLIRMWMAHGFVPSCERLDVKGHEIFNQLVQRSFLQVMEMESGRENSLSSMRIPSSMHDLVRDLAQSIAGKECISISEGFPEVAAPTDVHHLSVDSYEKFDIKQMMKTSPNLRTVMHYYLTEKDCNIFSQYYTSLRVLLLQDVPIGLPISTKFLQHLRYLGLSRNKISEFPESICTLFHLQTLDLSASDELCQLPESIYTLPNLQVLNLASCRKLHKLPERMQCMSALRHLNLDGCYMLRKMPAGMGRMTNLQTLTMYVVSDEDGRGIEELNGLHLSTKLELSNLRCVETVEKARQVNLHSKDLHWLTLCWGGPDHILPSNYSDAGSNLDRENGEEVLEALKPPGCLNVLTIKGYSGFKYPAWMMGCLFLLGIHLEYCTGLHQLPPLWRLSSLETLSLTHMDNLKYIISDGHAAGDTTVQPFPSLKKLKLRCLRRLEGWWENKNAYEATSNCFPALTTLGIEECPELAGSMPLLSCLQVLTLSESRKIRLGSFQPNKTTSIRHLQRLEYLVIAKCDEVALSWRDQEEEMTVFGSCIRYMDLKDCDWMFSSGCSRLWECMTSLSRLQVSQCQALGNLFEVLQGFKSLTSLDISESVNANGTEATTSTVEACLPRQLQSLTFSSCESLTTLMLRCPTSLRRIELKRCPNLVSLTITEQELSQLGSLYYIVISNCHKLMSLAVGMGGLTTLDVLIIWECTELMSLPECLLQRLPSTKTLVIRGCPKLEKKCTRGGEYWHFVRNNQNRDIGTGVQSSTPAQLLYGII